MMRTSLRKLRGGFGHHKHGDVRDFRPLSQSDELAQASQDLEDMRDCYDALLAAANAAANGAFEFLESLKELGACLLEKTALNEDEESGKVLLMLGKVQYEIQKFLNGYRSHIHQTITIPSESLLNELRTVEEMKRQCDERRDVYEYMVKKQKEKGRTRIGKGETFSAGQLQEARELYEEEATLVVFRSKSLKQGQSRSLLTQAARHHASQLNFFKKALKSLELVEPHVKLVTEQKHIDYQFNGLDDDDGDEIEDDDDYSCESHDDGELSFDYGQGDRGQDDVLTVGHSMELDEVELTFPIAGRAKLMKENLERHPQENLPSSVEKKKATQSAPLFLDKKLDFADKISQMRQSSTRKLQTYVLPTPADMKNSVPTAAANPQATTWLTNLRWPNNRLYHSSPLEPKRLVKDSAVEKLSGPAAKTHSILKENNSNSASTPLPPPLVEGLLLSRDPLFGTSTKKFKRQAFSGPLNNKTQSNQSVLAEIPPVFSGPVSRNPVSQPLPVSPKVTSSSPLMSPKINELHELPRPPKSSSPASSRTSRFGHSAPLVSRGPNPSVKNENVMRKAAPVLPTPSQVVPRSFSIPTSGSRGTSEVLDPSQDPERLERSEDVFSPPLTPMSLPNTQPSPTN